MPGSATGIVGSHARRRKGKHQRPGKPADGRAPHSARMFPALITGAHRLISDSISAP